LLVLGEARAAVAYEFLLDEDANGFRPPGGAIPRPASLRTPCTNDEGGLGSKTTEKCTGIICSSKPIVVPW
jgi:hypothetical protein